MEDGGDSEEDTSSRTNSTQEVSEDGESTNAHTTEQGSSGNVVVQDVNESGITVTLHGETVITELLGDITSRRAGEFDPEAGDEGTGTEHVSNVDNELERIGKSISEGGGSIQVVNETADRTSLLLIMRPLTEETDEEVSFPTSGQQLGDDHEVGGEGGDDDDGGVGGVEQLDGIDALLTTVLGVLDRQFHTEALEVDDDEEDDDGSKEVGDVGKTRAVEGIAESTDLVLTGNEAVEQGDDGTFEFLTTTVIDSGGREGSPHDRLADVGGDEQANTRTNTITLLQEFVQQENDDAGSRQLNDEKTAGEGTEFAGRTVHTRDDVDEGSGEGEDDAEQLLDVFVQLTFFLARRVENDELETVEELHDHGGGDDGADTEFHEGTTRN